MCKKKTPKHPPESEMTGVLGRPLLLFLPLGFCLFSFGLHHEKNGEISPVEFHMVYMDVSENSGTPKWMV